MSNVRTAVLILKNAGLHFAARNFMEQLFKQWNFYLASGIEAGAGLLIALVAIEAIARALWVFLSRKAP